MSVQKAYSLPVRSESGRRQDSAGSEEELEPVVQVDFQVSYIRSASLGSHRMAIMASKNSHHNNLLHCRASEDKQDDLKGTTRFGTNNYLFQFKLMVITRVLTP